MARKAAAAGRAKPGGARRRPPARRAPKADPKAARRWLLFMLAIVLGAALLRLGVNAAGWIPIHFDEAQYWFYGQELAFGHFSKPPLVGWLLRLSSEVAPHSTAMLRFWSVAAHAGIALALFAVARGLFGPKDGPELGFWAAAAYTAAPGVTWSAMIASTDPVMMGFWALALWAHVRAAEEGRVRWWALMGAAIGLGCLAKYTMIAFAGGALGYGLFSARRRDWRGPIVAAGVAALVVLPNIVWNAVRSFPTFGHIAEDAAAGTGAGLRPDKFAEFAGSQLGVIGPVVFVAILAALWSWRQWRADWRMRLLAWQTAPLLAAMLVLALLTRAQPNWAAPAYVAGTLLAVRWLMQRDWRRLLRLQLWIGAGAAALLWTLAALYGDQARDLPRWLDPFKKMRLGEPVCAAVLPAMAEEGADALLTDDRRRLSECIWLGGLAAGEFAVWNPGGGAANHYEMIASLAAGDERRFLLLMEGEGRADPLLDRFATADHVETLRFATHADREFVFELWIASGFQGYR